MNNMEMTKDKIVERLIKEKHITPWEAVILLKENVVYKEFFSPSYPANINEVNPYGVDYRNSSGDYNIDTTFTTSKK